MSQIVTVYFTTHRVEVVHSLFQGICGDGIMGVLYLKVCESVGTSLTEDLGDYHDTQRCVFIWQRFDDVIFRQRRLQLGA